MRQKKVPDSFPTGQTTSYIQQHALKLTITYTLISLISIFATDRAVKWVISDTAAALWVQTLKGAIFVLITALLIYWLALRSFDNISAQIVSERLDQTENLLKVMLANLGDVIFIIDPSGRTIKQCNEAVTTVFGYEPYELLNHSSEVLHVDHQSFLKFGAISEPILEEKGIFRTHYQMKHKDGTLIHTEHTVVTLHKEFGWREGVISIVRDITERLRLEAQLRQAQKLDSLGTLASGVAHEINNPLTAIKIQAQLLQRLTGTDSELHRRVSIIDKETDRAHKIINNLLGFTRLEREGVPPVPVPIKKIINDTLSLIQSIMTSDHIAVAVVIPDDLPPILCHSYQIEQVIMNLLINARDALNDKYPGEDENKRIQIFATVLQKGGQPWIRTTVTDYGPGITPESRERIFDPFYTTKPIGEGTGLGLWISYDIIKKHGGEIYVESKAGEYTQFHIDLPATNSQR